MLSNILLTLFVNIYNLLITNLFFINIIVVVINHIGFVFDETEQWHNNIHLKKNIFIYTLVNIFNRYGQQIFTLTDIFIFNFKKNKKQTRTFEIWDINKFSWDCNSRTFEILILESQ